MKGTGEKDRWEGQVRRTGGVEHGDLWGNRCG